MQVTAGAGSPVAVTVKLTVAEHCPGAAFAITGPVGQVIVGGIPVVMSADAVFPVPPLLEVTLPLTLCLIPGVVAVTVTLNMQLEPAAIKAPLSEIIFGPVVVSVPPQVEVGPDVGTVSPEGSVSVNATPVSPTVVFGLVIVNVRVVIWPGVM